MGEQQTPADLVQNDFPVHWDDPADEGKFWVRDRMHLPDPIAILETDLWGVASAGRNLANKFFGIPAANVARRINTYRYSHSEPTLTADRISAGERELEVKMQKAAADLERLWKESYLLEIQTHLAYWSEFDLAAASTEALAAHLDETMQRYQRCMEIHFLTVMPLYLAISLFEEMYRELFEDDDAFAAYRLLEGFPNKTTESGVELSKLSKMAANSSDIANALEANETDAVLDALMASEEGRAFHAKLHTYLQVYGQRGDVWSLRSTSWIEDPTPVLNNLRDYMAQERDLAAEATVAAVRRQEALARAREKLQGYPQPVVKQFESLLADAQFSNVLSEDHGYWIDFRCSHQVRMVLMEIGRRFVNAGIVERPDDLFHLTLAEIRADLASPAASRRSLVAKRATELERWKVVTPPDTLGPAPDGPPPDNLMTRAGGRLFGTAVQKSDKPGVIQGHAGSPGVASGRARIIRSIAEASILQPGDILVAVTTAPPWTPLFGTVAAVVTDTGGILSHCAVVAREYGIPAVVGTGIASSTIVDGQWIEVDGDTGVVRMVDA